MIPYAEQPAVSIGPITIAAFGVIVASAVLIGLRLGAWRFEHLNLDQALGERMAGWVIVCGFLGAHLFSVLFYFPDRLAENPLLLFKIWEDISSFGGIVGGLVGIWLFFRFSAKHVDAARRLAYLDAAAFVFPMALMVGRIACSLAHDHPGRVTSFPLAVSLKTETARGYIVDVYRDAGRLAELPPATTLPSLGFHDLGWYEFLYLAIVVVPVFVLLDRKERAPGFFLAAFAALYMPIRFMLDFLRVSDARYGGLTPAQWAAAAILLSLPVVWRLARGVAVNAREGALT